MRTGDELLKSHLDTACKRARYHIPNQLISCCLDWIHEHLLQEVTTATSYPVCTDEGQTQPTRRTTTDHPFCRHNRLNGLCTVWHWHIWRSISWEDQEFALDISDSREQSGARNMSESIKEQLLRSEVTTPKLYMSTWWEHWNRFAYFFGNWPKRQQSLELHTG